MSAKEHRLLVGLEVHVQLRTRTKCFCGCPTQGARGPNARTCPTCLGLPGALPVLSRAALELAVRTAVALDCTIAEATWWERKHYGYADLPKGYQITQQTAPIGTGGCITFELDGDVHTVPVRRVQLEEDTGRSSHADDGTRLDFDRAGTPLVEIVTEPTLTSPEEVRACLTELRHLLRWIEASHADMEKGEMRCEPNVNVHVRVGDQWTPTPVAEIKNLNSISAAAQAVAYERERQLEALRAGGPAGPLPRTTRGWDETTRHTTPQRAKEEAADYRFLPEPDLPAVLDCRTLAEAARTSLPEPARARRERLIAEHGISRESATVLTANRTLADWYERAALAAGERRAAMAGWVVGDVLRWFENDAVPVFSPEDLGDLVRAVERGRIPRDAARRRVLPAMASGAAWREFVREEDLLAAPDDEVAEAVRQAAAARPDLMSRAVAGHDGVMDVLVGDVMHRTRGRAEGAHVRDLLRGLVAAATRETRDDAPPRM